MAAQDVTPTLRKSFLHVKQLMRSMGVTSCAAMLCFNPHNACMQAHTVLQSRSNPPVQDLQWALIALGSALHQAAVPTGPWPVSAAMPAAQQQQLRRRWLAFSPTPVALTSQLQAVFAVADVMSWSCHCQLAVA
jgi:hypothetical protein